MIQIVDYRSLPGASIAIATEILSANYIDTDVTLYRDTNAAFSPKLVKNLSRALVGKYFFNEDLFSSSITPSYKVVNDKCAIDEFIIDENVIDKLLIDEKATDSFTTNELATELSGVFKIFTRIKHSNSSQYLEQSLIKELKTEYQNKVEQKMKGLELSNAQFNPYLSPVNSLQENKSCVAIDGIELAKTLYKMENSKFEEPLISHGKGNAVLRYGESGIFCPSTTTNLLRHSLNTDENAVIIEFSALEHLQERNVIAANPVLKDITNCFNLAKTISVQLEPGVK